MANTVIQLKKSGTPSAAPSTLANGELAINYADGKLFYKDVLGNIQEISGGGGGPFFGTINVAGTLVVPDIPGDILTIAQGNNIELTPDIVNDSYTITANLKPAFDIANVAFGHSNLTYNAVNSVFAVANAAFGSANNVAPQVAPAYNTANQAYAVANTKTYTFKQNTAPATANISDLWVNIDTGYVYENFGNTTNPIWAEFGPTTLMSAINTVSYLTSAIIFVDASQQNTAAAPWSTTNTLFGVANASFGKANTALQNTTGTFAGDLTVTGNTIINKQAVVYYRPSSTVNAAVHILAANTLGGTGYADVLKLQNLSGGATNPGKSIRLNSIGTLEIINSAYSANIFELTDAGDMIIPGNSTFNGTKPGYAPNRPAFRVYGDSTTNINATTTLNNTNWAVDFQQGSNLNGTTGVFTAPVAGLYSVNLTARTQTNSYVGTSAIAVQRTSGVLTTNVCYIEWYNNTSANHMGSSTIVKLAVGDTLKVVVTAGQVTFDLNDNWAVAYIG